MKGETTGTKPLPVSFETEDFRQQQTAFCVLTLFVLAMLVLLHTLFAYVLGEPSVRVLGVLGLSFALRVVELVWLRKRGGVLTARIARVDGAASIVMVFVLAGLLAWLTNRDHSPYQVLLAIPVLQSAFLFGLPSTILTIIGADGMIFLWLRHYFALHPPPSGGEYLEAGMFAIVLALVGLLVWFLVSQLRTNQMKLSNTLTDLRTTRERLVSEEKLAAVGRLASGIAHEIRNPVGMIMSALATAEDPATDDTEREEMFSIAGRQASRLEALTTEFLTYARPSVPRRSPILISDLLSGIEGVTRVRAAGRAIQVACHAAEGVTVVVDASQVEGALLNLTLNAIDAIRDEGMIEVRAELGNNVLQIEVENSGSAIPDPQVERIFEPFFTTKPNGTGLGLAIARGVARAHGGDLWISWNEDGRVAFTMTLTAFEREPDQQEAGRG